MALNKDLLKDTLAYILLNPQKWSQGTWARTTVTSNVCSTTHCFAGTTLVLGHKGAKFTGGYHDVDGAHIYYDMAIPGLGNVDIGEQAARDLGLTVDQADALFESSNSLPTLLHMVAALLDDADADLYDFAD